MVALSHLKAGRLGSNWSDRAVCARHSMHIPIERDRAKLKVEILVGA